MVLRISIDTVFVTTVAYIGDLRTFQRLLCRIKPVASKLYCKRYRVELSSTETIDALVLAYAGSVRPRVGKT